MFIRFTQFLCALVLLGIATNSWAQETSSDWAWKGITRIDGVEFFYIYYSEVRDDSNGIVLKLVNWNDYPVDYLFTVVFKAGRDHVEERVSGSIQPKTLVTGDEAGLFFLPFEDGRSVGELGIKRYRIRRKGSPSTRR